MDWLRALPLIGKALNWGRSWMGLNREHDAAIFRRLNEIANESMIDSVLNGRIYSGSIRLEDSQVLEDLVTSLNLIENQFLNSTVRLRAEQLAWELRELLSIVFKSFFSVREGWLKFRPDPIDSQLYDAEWAEITRKIDSGWDAYRAYRMAVKDYIRL